MKKLCLVFFVLYGSFFLSTAKAGWFLPLLFTEIVASSAEESEDEKWDRKCRGIVSSAYNDISGLDERDNVLNISENLVALYKVEGYCEGTTSSTTIKNLKKSLEDLKNKKCSTMLYDLQNSYKLLGSGEVDLLEAKQVLIPRFRKNIDDSSFGVCLDTSGFEGLLSKLDQDDKCLSKLAEADELSNGKKLSVKNITKSYSRVKYAGKYF